MQSLSVLSSSAHLLHRFISNIFSPSPPRMRFSEKMMSTYGVCPEGGFIPSLPLPMLPSCFSCWEDALACASPFIGANWRSQIQQWPVLEIDSLLNCDLYLQRAHYVLSWTLHFYVHSMPEDTPRPIVIPRALAVPLVGVSRALGIAPVLCYADTVLWNWELIDDTEPISSENIRPRYLFSGTEDEAGFYISCARVEFVGIELLRLIENFKHIRDPESPLGICTMHQDLVKLKQVIADLSEAIQSVRDICDPRVFYWEVRRWFNGDNTQAPDGPKWIYEGVKDSDRLYTSGPSAGQSTIMHALDIFLDVDHLMQKRARSVLPTAAQKTDPAFFQRMRQYMPRQARNYLESLDALPMTVRDIALRTPSLQEPYNACIEQLRLLRDLHLRIATLYIISMAKTVPPGRDKASVTDEEVRKSFEARSGPSLGTGGNHVSLLLKAGRDATKQAFLDTQVKFPRHQLVRG